MDGPLKKLASKLIDLKLNFCKLGIKMFSRKPSSIKKDSLTAAANNLKLACSNGDISVLINTLNALDIHQDKNKPLLHILIENNFDEMTVKQGMELLLKNDADINAQDNIGNTALHLACAMLKPNIVRLLVKFKAKAQIQNKKGFMPIFFAYKENTLDLERLDEYSIEVQQAAETDTFKVSPLLRDVFNEIYQAKDFEVNAFCPEGKTILMYAIENKQQAIFDCLMKDNKVDVNLCQDKDSINETLIKECQIAGIDLSESVDSEMLSMSPLTIAIFSEQNDMAKKLVQRGARGDLGGHSALQAVSLLPYGSAHSLVTDMLKVPGMNANLIPASDMSSLESAYLGGDKFLISELLKAGARADAKGYHEQNPIIFDFVENGEIDFLKLSLEFGETDFAVIHNGENLLHFAVLKAVLSNSKVLLNRLKAIEFLCKLDKININAKNAKGATPLDYVLDYSDVSLERSRCTNGTHAIIKLLLKYGAKADLIRPEKKPGLFIFVENKHLNYLQMLDKAGRTNFAFKHDGKNLLHHSIEHKAEEIAMFLIEKTNIDINEVDKYGYTSLHRAIKEKSLNISTLLIGKGAKLNLPGPEGDTPLHYALDRNYSFEKYPYKELIPLLLEHGARADFKRRGKVPAVFTFVKEEQIDYLKLVAKAGKTNFGITYQKNTLLHAAANSKNQGIIKFLLGLKVIDIDTKNKDGRTPIEVSYDNNCINIFIDAGADASNILHSKIYNNSHAMLLAKIIKANATDINKINYHNRRTLLFNMVLRNHEGYSNVLDIIKPLVQGGASTVIKDNEGRTVLEYIQKKHEEDIENIELTNLLNLLKSAPQNFVFKPKSAISDAPSQPKQSYEPDKSLEEDLIAKMKHQLPFNGANSNEELLRKAARKVLKNYPTKEAVTNLANDLYAHNLDFRIQVNEIAHNGKEGFQLTNALLVAPGILAGCAILFEGLRQYLNQSSSNYKNRKYLTYYEVDEYQSHTDVDNEPKGYQPHVDKKTGAGGFQAHPDDNDDIGGYQAHSEKDEHRGGFQPEKKEWLNKVPGFIPLFGIGPIIMEKNKHKSQGNIDRPNAPDPDKKYHPAPKILIGFPDATKVPGKTPVQGGGGKLRDRWVLPNGEILEWDYQHGAVEKYTNNGKNHLGEFDPNTGKQVKPGNPGRNIKKFM